jgi:hypothetical protein
MGSPTDRWSDERLDRMLQALGFRTPPFRDPSAPVRATAVPGWTRLVAVAASVAILAVVAAAVAVSLPPRQAGPGGAGGTPPGTVVAADSPTPSPTPTPEPSPSPAPSVEPSPSPEPSDDALARSDSFWDEWMQEPPPLGLPFDSDSLSQNARRADLVVRGPITDLYIGEYWARESGDPWPLAYITVRVDEVFKGEPASRTPGYVEVQVGVAGPDIEEIRARLPGHDNVWFLMYDWPRRDTPAQRSPEIARFTYVLKGLYQGVLRDIRGEVTMLEAASYAQAYGSDKFPLPLEGTSFEDLVQQVRDVAQAQPTEAP